MQNEKLIELAKTAIEYDRVVKDADSKLQAIKDQIRIMCDGSKETIIVPDHGVVTVSQPRKGGVLTGEKLEVDIKLIDNYPELKQKLVEKKIIKVIEVYSTPAAASVTIKPNA